MSQKKNAVREAAEDLAPLRKEISALLKKLDGEELSWLRDQAEVLVGNKLIEAQSKRLKESLRAVGSGPRDNPHSDIVLEVSKASRSANVIINNMPKLLDEHELTTVVNMCLADAPLDERAARLYRWMKTERRDILIDVGISQPGSKTLASLIIFLEKKFGKMKK